MLYLSAAAAAALALLPSAAVAPTVPATTVERSPNLSKSSGGERCLNAAPRHAQGVSAAPRRLDELPPGEMHLAVQRRVGDCIEPVLLREERGR